MHFGDAGTAPSIKGLQRRPRVASAVYGRFIYLVTCGNMYLGPAVPKTGNVDLFLLKSLFKSVLMNLNRYALLILTVSDRNVRNYGSVIAAGHTVC